MSVAGVLAAGTAGSGVLYGGYLWMKSQKGRKETEERENIASTFGRNSPEFAQATDSLQGNDAHIMVEQSLHDRRQLGDKGHGVSRSRSYNPNAAVIRRLSSERRRAKAAANQAANPAKAAADQAAAPVVAGG